mmetsp:Transcript_24152/g.58920  ORF Transcript_24152/g.58920 Transcript_24152/m.58920 type:complete len:248 (+) Transcript_24152:1098-1841(+)
MCRPGALIVQCSFADVHAETAIDTKVAGSLHTSMESRPTHLLNAPRTRALKRLDVIAMERSAVSSDARMDTDPGLRPADLCDGRLEDDADEDRLEVIDVDEAAARLAPVIVIIRMLCQMLSGNFCIKSSPDSFDSFADSFFWPLLLTRAPFSPGRRSRGPPKSLCSIFMRLRRSIASSICWLVSMMTSLSRCSDGPFAKGPAFAGHYRRRAVVALTRLWARGAEAWTEGDRGKARALGVARGPPSLC